MTEAWLKVEEVCSLTGEIKETVRRKCKSGQYKSKFTKEGRKKLYQVALSSLSFDFQQKYISEFQKNDEFAVEVVESNVKIDEYSSAPLWARKQADKYIELFNLTDKLSYKEKLSFLEAWNINNPSKKVAYSTLMEAKRKYIAGGVDALLSKKGHNCNARKIEPEWYEYFKSLYLKEGAPSANTCWLILLGHVKKSLVTEVYDFPQCCTFVRRLNKEHSPQEIYLARYGQSAWNRKYANYISRDYSNVLAGAFWVSDHAQIDIAVSIDGSICFPWVTVFRDVKTSKWLGWFLHAESPNSDHIFQTFYYAVLKYGIPEDVYIDNGKDYRCKDFAGGRSVLVNHTSDKENSLLRNLGINVHFAQPYNGQTKPVERDFLKIKTYLSKNMVGYRGGKITERPEKLKDEIKNNKIMQFEEFKSLFDDFIENILNKMPSKGKVLQGRCPDELWAEEFKVKKVLKKDALKLFCMRTSREISIGRNGITDSQLKISYWAEWMIQEKGRKVFIRRDVNAYQEAWVFDAVTEEFLGKANVNQASSFMAKTDVEKTQYKQALANKNKEKKMLKEYIKAKYNPTNEEITENLKFALGQKDYKDSAKIAKISNTQMDKVVAANNKQERENTKTLKTFGVEAPSKPKIFLTESEKRRYEKRLVI